MKLFQFVHILYLHLHYLAFSVFALQSQIALEASDEFESSHPLSIAIIGAGAAGSSAAYYLHQFSSASKIPIKITIFDPNIHAGGRSTTVDALEDANYPTELGASIFVEINHILYDAAREFGLSTSSAFWERPKEADYALGVWDGKHFVFQQRSGASRWGEYWDIAKLLWKYGMAPIRTQRLAKATVERFLKFYEEPIFPFRSLTEAVRQVDLVDFTNKTGEETLDRAGVGENFSRDIIQASTRVNYGQNLAGIHGLETLVCMSTDGAMSIKGGNWRIFEEMVKRSGAHVRYNTTVTDLVASTEGPYTIVSRTELTRFPSQAEQPQVNGDTESFDTVIIATPLQFSNITITPPFSPAPEQIPYVTLYVTLLTSPHRLSPAYFGLDSQAGVPEMVITTLPADTHLGAARGIDGVGPAGFWSVSTLRAIKRAEARVQYLYKVFSPAPLTGSWVSSLLGFEYQNTTADDPLSGTDKTDVSWLHEKKWHSYPYEVPTARFAEMKLDTASNELGGKGVWYTSGIEGFISTMETSALMGKNVARLIMDELGDDINSDVGGTRRDLQY